VCAEKGLQADFQGRKILGDVVVQIAGDFGAFVFLGLDQRVGQ
jgi:hypothetical protein